MELTNTKPRLSLPQIVNMSVGFFGIQVGFALQNANVSRIFQTLGADENELPILWLAAPFTGLVVQPIIGYLSDRTWSPKWGRRRPFFALGAILASLALFAMPNAAALWMAAIFLWLMDASINVTMEPFRAFVGDMLPSEQRTTGFAMQTFFIGLGAVCAGFLPSLFTHFGVSNTAAAGIIPDSVKYSFYIGAIVYAITVMYTVFTTKEYPPEDLAAFEEEKQKMNFKEGVKETVMGLFNMPKTMQQLAVVQFFTWLGLFAMWIYSTPSVTRHMFNATDPTSAAYNEGANWVGTCFAIKDGVATIFAFLLPLIAQKIGRKMTHLVCLVLGGIGLISIGFSTNPNIFLFAMIMQGLAWASILSMPYVLLAGALPANKMGYYMGVFNFFIVIPQIVQGLILGKMNAQFFGGDSIYTIMLGGAFMVLAGFLTLTVHDVDEVKST